MSVAFVVVLTAFLSYQHRLSRGREAVPMPPLSGKPEPRMKIRGFRFDGHYKGEKVLRIKGDTFVIEKKKVGFFRLGMMSVARIRNAEVDIYGASSTPERKETRKEPGIKSSPSAPSVSKSPSFGNVFHRDALPPVPIRGVYSFVMEPVTIKLHVDRKMVTWISAGSASIRLKSRDILFKGNVRARSGERALETEQLSFLPNDGVLKCPNQYILQTSTKRFEGTFLIADIFLNVLGLQERRSRSLLY